MGGKSSKDNGPLALDSGMESPVTQVNASHWSIHRLECSMSTFLLILVVMVGVCWVLRRRALCCWASQMGRGKEGTPGVGVPMGPGVTLSEIRAAITEADLRKSSGAKGRFGHV